MLAQASFDLAPTEAIDYFRKKGYRISFDWRDMWQQEHAYAFTVAKAMNHDILQDIRQAMDAAIANGTTFDEFRKTLKPVLQAKGWWGKKMMMDPASGEEKEVQLGSSRRLQIIYDTNMRTAYAAGRWEQFQRNKKTRPYLRYSAVLDWRTRPQHRAWNGIILPIDHPWWNEFYPPNGWNCRCTAQQMGQRDLDRYGYKLTDEPPPVKDRLWRDKRNGELLKVPVGIDPGFAYNVGQARMEGLTPPALNMPLKVPYSGPPAAVAHPPVSPLPPDLILPADTKPEKAIEQFLAAFDTKPGNSIVYEDVTGEPVIISERLFTRPDGSSKVTKRGRMKYLLALAAAIREPDEIWNLWQEYPAGRHSLTRHYLKYWADELGKVVGFTMFDTSVDGWRGVTSFAPDDVDYIVRQRKGSLVYRKPDDAGK